MRSHVITVGIASAVALPWLLGVSVLLSNVMGLGSDSFHTKTDRSVMLLLDTYPINTLRNTLHGSYNITIDCGTAYPEMFVLLKYVGKLVMAINSVP